MNYWEIIGYMAATIGAVSLVPEIIKALRTHHLQDVSWGMLFMFATASLLWGTYGAHSDDLPLIVSAVINLCSEITLMALKLHYSQKRIPLLPHKNLAKPKLQITTYQIPATLKNSQRNVVAE